MVLSLKNSGNAPVSGVSAFSLQNYHLGFGRPGVRTDIGANGESVTIQPNRDIEERGFAGVMVTRLVGGASRVGAWNQASSPTENVFRVVDSTMGDVPSKMGDLGVADDWAHAYQVDLGDIAPGQTRWVAIVVAHHGDPFGAAVATGWIDAYTANKSPEQLLNEERASWETFQRSLVLPKTLSTDEEAVARQSAAVLEMAQMKDKDAFLREVLSRDGEPRLSRFRALDGGSALPGTVVHRGFGAILASLPPGEWTYSWIRDGAYAAAAMSVLGMTTQSRDALQFYLDAEGGRFQNWNELRPYNMPPYVISLTRYVGFGVEETDFNDYGPNIEFDGFGLFLWALREHEVRTKDTSLTDNRWEEIATKIADPLLALVEPSTGLIRKDSSIWETHWNGRERTWTYTSLTAARGLCDAAAIAERKQDMTRAMKYRAGAQALRQAIATRLTDGAGALASNREELQTGSDYFDAAVFDAFAFGLFDPAGRIGRATASGLDKIRVSAGPGWSRNDDRRDHQGKMDLSPWGSEYDSAEWVITDVRGSMVLRAQGNASRADSILKWITEHANKNADLIPETFDETTGVWKFNAPMVGFGAGVYVLALDHRASGRIDPACGAFFDEQAVPDAGSPNPPGGSAGGGAAQPSETGGGSAGGGGSRPRADGGVSSGKDPRGCGCSTSEAWLLIGAAPFIIRRRRS
jgi:GH15 family glucan-1,4-alpha-glucosidase